MPTTRTRQSGKAEKCSSACESVGAGIHVPNHVWYLVVGPGGSAVGLTGGDPPVIRDGDGARAREFGRGGAREELGEAGDSGGERARAVPHPLSVRGDHGGSASAAAVASARSHSRAVSVEPGVRLGLLARVPYHPLLAPEGRGVEAGSLVLLPETPTHAKKRLESAGDVDDALPRRDARRGIKGHRLVKLLWECLH